MNTVKPSKKYRIAYQVPMSMVVDADSAEEAGVIVKKLLMYKGTKPQAAFVLSVDRIMPSGKHPEIHTPNVVKIGS